MNQHLNTPIVIIKSIGFNKDINELEFEILDENPMEGADSQKWMLSDEVEDFFDSHFKNWRECYDLERSISSDDSDAILTNSIIMKSGATKKQNIN